MNNLDFLEDNENELFIIDQMLEELKGEQRGYLGMSGVGDPCGRKVWFQYHTDFQPVFSAQLQRIFRLGHLIEQTIVDDLNNSGFPVTCSQRTLSDFDGDFQGHCDGVIPNTPDSSLRHVLEIKSANDKNFNLFKKHGVQGHPIYGEKYYTQGQLYMGYSKLKRCLFIVENKNDCKRYRERIRFDKGYFEAAKARAKTIIDSPFPLWGISQKASFYKCKWCNYNNDDYCRRYWKGEPKF